MTVTPSPRQAVLAAALIVTLGGCRAKPESDTQNDQPRARALAGVETFALPVAARSAAPNLATGSDELRLVWISEASEPTVLLSSLDHGSSHDSPQWSEPQRVHTSARVLVNWADVPAVGQTPSGRAVVAWPERHPSPQEGYGVRVAAELDDGSFGPPWSPDDIQRGPESGFVGFATSAEGLRMFWLDGRELEGEGGTMQLRSVLIDDEGQQAGASQIHDQRTCECCKLGVASVDGRALAVYRDRSEAEIRDIQLAGPGHAPTPVASDGWTITGCPVNGPAIAAAGDRAHVGWFTGAGGQARVKLASGAPASGFGEPLRVDLGAPAGRVDVLAMPDGGALMSWFELDERRPGHAQLLARRLLPSGKLGDALEIAEVGAARDWGFPKTALIEGGARVVWVFTNPSDSAGPMIEARVGAV